MINKHLNKIQTMINGGLTNEANRLLNDCLLLSEDIDDIFDKDEILLKISSLFSKNKNCAQAKEVAENIWDSHIRIKTLFILFEECISIFSQEESSNLVLDITDASDFPELKAEKKHLFPQIISVYLNNNRPDQAFKIVKYLPSKIDKIDKTCAIVLKYHELGLQAEANKLFNFVLKQSETIIGEQQKQKAKNLVSLTKVKLESSTSLSTDTKIYQKKLNIDKLLKYSITILDTIKENERPCKFGSINKGLLLCSIAKIYILMENKKKALEYTEKAKNWICAVDGEFDCSYIAMLSTLYFEMNMMDEFEGILMHKCGRRNRGYAYSEFVVACIGLNKLNQLIDYLDNQEKKGMVYNGLCSTLSQYYRNNNLYLQSFQWASKIDDEDEKYGLQFSILNSYIKSSAQNSLEGVNEFNVKKALDVLLNKSIEKKQQIDIANLYSLINEKDISNKIIGEVLDYAEGYILNDIANIYIQNGKISKAIEISKSTDRYDSNLTNIAKKYISDSEYEKAFKVINKIKDSWSINSLLGLLINKYSEENNYAMLYETIEKNICKIDATDIYKALQICNKKDDILNMIGKRLKTKECINRLGSNYISNYLIEIYLDNYETDKALEFAKGLVKYGYESDTLFLSIAKKFIDEREYQKAFDLVKSKEHKDIISKLVAYQYALSGKYSKALQFVDTVEEYHKGYILLEIAKAYYLDKDIENCLNLLKQIPHGDGLDGMDMKVFDFYIRKKQYRDAFSVIDIIYYKDKALNILAQELAINAPIDEIFYFIEKVNDQSLRITFSNKVAEYIFAELEND